MPWGLYLLLHYQAGWGREEEGGRGRLSRSSYSRCRRPRAFLLIRTRVSHLTIVYNRIWFKTTLTGTISTGFTAILFNRQKPWSGLYRLSFHRREILLFPDYGPAAESEMERKTTGRRRTSIKFSRLLFISLPFLSLIQYPNVCSALSTFI